MPTSQRAVQLHEDHVTLLVVDKEEEVCVCVHIMNSVCVRAHYEQFIMSVVIVRNYGTVSTR